MNPKLLLIVTMCALLGAGCGDDSGSSGAGGSGAVGGADATGGTGGTPSGENFVVKWGPVEVPPGESTQCVVKRLGNDTSVFINEVHNVLGATSHHFIVYQVNDTVERPDPYPCSPFEGSGTEANLLMITQKADDRLRFPKGVAYELDAGQMIRLELHFINVSAAPQMAEATSTFGTVAEDSIQFRAGIEFLGPVGFAPIPKNDTATLETPVQVNSALADANFFAITGHQHKLGTNVVVDLVDENRDVVQAVYDVENFVWDEPETVRHEPPFQIPSGGAFNLRCDWNNTTDQPVGFGTSVDDEMCFFWAYYYR
ncbi:MAG: hypothetical protein WBG86_08590 [Polyangiales bacterium]